MRREAQRHATLSDGTRKNPLPKMGRGLNNRVIRRESDECLVASAVFKTVVPDNLRWVGSIPTLSANN
jgi:hypothetical protein